MKTDKKTIQKRYREKNRETLKKKNREYKELNKEKIKASNKLYRENNKESIKQKSETYRLNHKEELSSWKKKYRKQNKELLKEKDKLYRETHRGNFSKYKKERKKVDKLYFLKLKIYNIVYKAVKHKVAKHTSTLEILGCSYECFKEYLESKFEPWMTWENYGKYNGELNYGWDIDHIIPLTTAKTEDDVIRLSHYTNLRPLCSYTNRVIKKDIINFIPSNQK